MSSKLQIVDELGEGALLFPARINRALKANDQVKYYFSLLQAACAHADHPTQDFSDLRAERIACGSEDDVFDQVIARSRAIGDDDSYSIPYARRIHDLIVGGLREMAAPDFDPLRTIVSISPLRRFWRIWRAARRQAI